MTLGGLPPSEPNDLARSFAHDFANVFTIINGNLALAERHAAGNSKLIRLLNNMRLASERGAALSQRLMALSPERGFGGGFAEEPEGFAGPGGGRRILVVEDDPLVAEVAVAVLEDMGHQVDLRQDAPSALVLLREGSVFDLIFSDIVMPGGMSGIELAEQIAETFPAVPILLATGYSNAALAPGALRFPILAKPYSVQELTRRVTQMLPA